jgi:hypothetical protein
MTEQEQIAVYGQYQATFGEPLKFPPLSYGHQGLTVNDLCEYAKKALETGKPINWDDYLAELPEDAQS